MVVACRRDVAVMSLMMALMEVMEVMADFSWVLAPPQVCVERELPPKCRQAVVSKH